MFGANIAPRVLVAMNLRLIIENFMKVSIYGIVRKQCLWYSNRFLLAVWRPYLHQMS